MDLIDISEAARLLGLSKQTLRTAESSDGRWTFVRGARLRVFRIGPTPNGQRRYRRTDVLSLLSRESSGGYER